MWRVSRDRLSQTAGPDFLPEPSTAECERVTGSVTDADDFAHHRAGIENLLGLAADLNPVEQDRIRFAVQMRRDPEAAADMIGPLDAPTPGARLVAAMTAA